MGANWESGDSKIYNITRIINNWIQFNQLFNVSNINLNYRIIFRHDYYNCSLYVSVGRSGLEGNRV